MARTASAVVRDVQVLLGVRVDGSWGPRVSTAYELADDFQRAAVQEVLRRDGYSMESLKRVTYDLRQRDFELRPGQRLKQSSVPVVAASRPVSRGVVMATTLPTVSRWVPEAELNRMIERVAGRMAVVPSVLKGFINLEASQTVNGGVRYYDAASVSPNGAYRGLGQMGVGAWGDVQKRFNFKEPYSNWADPEINLQATALYMRLNEVYLRAKGYKGPFTANVAYAAHNQGAGGFMSLLVGGQVRGGQSSRARGVIAQAVSEAKLA